jgi:hypothetical protein
MDFSLNEAARTRMPAMFFGDNSMNLHHASYGVPGRIHDAGSASFVVSLCMSVIKRGYRLRHIRFRHVLRHLYFSLPKISWYSFIRFRNITFD